MNMTPEQVSSVFVNFGRKKKTTEYLRMSPLKDIFET